MEQSLVHYYGKQTSRCGYCKNTECSETYGMHAYTMATQDYQDLIDRGWRRSGHYCYKPNNEITCCPCYTIRCDANEFKLSKSHKKILKRMNRFLCNGEKDKNEDTDIEEATREIEQDHSADCPDETKEVNISSPDVTMATCSQSVISSREKAAIHLDDSSKKSLTEVKPPCKKAKQIRKERREAKLLAKSISADSQKQKNSDSSMKESITSDSEKSIKDYVQSTSLTDRHKLKLKLVLVSSKLFTKTLQESYELYERYQATIHKVQKESVSDYLRFLQKSPLKHTKPIDGPICGYGSFHQQYWLDDKLIAVGVVDILPYCVSSVYFFYDPDYNFLSLGTYGSLREIEFVQELSKTVPSLKYYYMGYYIHSCPKMRYKGKLKPSYLLCSETYTWKLLTNDILNRLDTEKYHRFNDDPDAQDADTFLKKHLDLVLFLVDHKSIVPYREYVQITGENCEDTIMEYGKLVGKQCAHRMLYVKT